MPSGNDFDPEHAGHVPASPVPKTTATETTTTTTAGAEPVKLETTSLERGLNHRRVLFDDSAARRAYPSDSTVRARIHRPALEWAAAAVRLAWNAVAGSRRDDDGPSDRIEVRG
jgi:hypothetical protein